MALAFIPGSMWWISVGIFALLGVFNGIVNIYYGTVMQRVTKPEFMGKVFGLLSTVSQGLQPLSQGMSGIVAEFVSLPILYGVCGAAVTGGGLQFGFLPGIKTFLGGDSEENETAPGQPVAAEA